MQWPRKKMLVGIIYRPPDTDMDLFSTALNGILTRSNISRNSVYIMGDFNINLMNSDSHQPTAEFLETMMSYGMMPLITKPQE